MKKRDPTDFMAFLDNDTFDSSNVDAFHDRTGLEDIGTFTTERNDLFGFNDDSLSDAFPRPNQGIGNDKNVSLKERSYIKERLQFLKSGGAPNSNDHLFVKQFDPEYPMSYINPNTQKVSTK